MKIIIINNASKIIFFLLPIFYFFAYAPYGQENNDTGFILGLAWQVFNGASLYEDIIYIRPPISPLLHSVLFYLPWDAAAITSRALFYIQVFVYNLLTVRLFVSDFNSSSVAYYIGAISFIFCVHTFPPMAWHTVDGIFFSVIGIYLVLSSSRDISFGGFFGALALFAAALSKQPFYAIPIAVVVYLLAEQGRFRRAALVSMLLISFVFIFIFALKLSGTYDQFLTLTSGQTSLRDLLSVGLISFLRDLFSKTGVLVFTGFGFFVLISYVLRDSNKENIAIYFYLAAVAWLALIPLVSYYVRGTYLQIGAIIDIPFLLAGILAATLFFFRRYRWLNISILLLFVSWSSSISWGNQTTALYSAPIFFLFGLCLLRCYDKHDPLALTAKGVTFGLVMISFWVGFQHPYNLEYKAKRSEMTLDLGKVFPAFKYIKVDKKTYDQYSELKKLVSTYGGTYVVLPNMPLAHLVTGTLNPIGVDWPMNAEINNDASKVLQRIESSGVIVFVLRETSPDPRSAGKYGSLVTMSILKNWEKIANFEYFDVYKKPSF